MHFDHRPLLEDHAARVAALAAVDSRYVTNKDWMPFLADAKPKLIVVADNPGAKEHENGEYLSGRGQAGRRAREFFDGVFGAESFGRDVLPLNKSSYHTNRTGGLEAMLRAGGCATKEAEAIRADMRANGRLVVGLVAALRVPALFIGSETGSTFGAFRNEFDKCSAETQAKAGEITAAFGGRPVDPFPLIPHFSMSKAFCRNSNEAWNTRIDAFAERWAHVGGLITGKGNLSSMRLLELADKVMLTDYLEAVMLEIAEDAEA